MYVFTNLQVQNEQLEYKVEVEIPPLANTSLHWPTFSYQLGLDLTSTSSLKSNEVLLNSDECWTTQLFTSYSDINKTYRIRAEMIDEYQT